ncbi:EF-hand domain-containing protein [Polaribacter sp. Z014]|uniref:EF-hand domain-containing protein n=1 Tax=unclassified Polaribacter TaxID=196858 RepID=UPI00193C5FB6|nr:MULTISPECIES: EF-hand domain-containing protein [unclassified Polaribacter]MCL7764662.1 EF-hand domain-containing protein [Polaribacter sp. Z014]QVY65857.1 EF-hand domain-containing protein [Polaribacter sp. Q13]
MKKSTNKILAVIIVSLGLSASTFAQAGNSDERPKGPPTFKQLLKDLDANEDGKISLKEVKGPLAKDFKKIDTDEDGFLSEKEIKNAPKPERKQRPRN